MQAGGWPPPRGAGTAASINTMTHADGACVHAPVDPAIEVAARKRDALAISSPIALVANNHRHLLTRLGWAAARTLVFDGDPVAALAGHVAESAAPLYIVATAADIDDHLLFAALGVYQDFVDGPHPFAAAPRIGLIIGRDDAVLERNLRKLIATDTEPTTHAEFALFTPNSPDHRIATLVLSSGPPPGIEAVQCSLRRDALEAAYARPIAAAAIATHGFDGCADGGDGTVLCGLHRDRQLSQPGTPGYLACGHGVACPRGPRPLQLSGFGAKMLMVAACNGLRTSDSVLNNDFNLALAFAEGPGEGYASTVFSAQGNVYAATAFLAAIASGYDLCAATLLANLLIARGGLERTAYLPIGRLDATPAPRAPTIVDVRGTNAASIAIVAVMHCVELRIDTPVWLDLYRRQRLGLRTGRPADGSVFWCTRIVHAGSRDEPYLEMFVFSFPQPLAGLAIEIWDMASASDEIVAATRGLARWLELGRLNDPELADIWDAAAVQFEQCRRDLFHLLRSGAYTVIEWPVLLRLMKNLHDNRQLVRHAVAAEIVGKLSNIFWLSNVLAADYRIAGHADDICAACAGRAIRKSLVNIASAERRAIIVCARCGIVSDLRKDGPFRSVRFAAPLVAGRGEELHAELQIRFAPDMLPAELDVQVRLSTLGQLTGEPIEQTLMTSEAGSARYRLVFALPPELRPHRFFIKAFVSTANDFAFCSHVFFAT